MTWLDKHFSAPGSINSKRITAKPAREGFGSMCACTEPDRTGIGAVCVEYGRRKWRITMLNHKDSETNIPGTDKWFYFYFWHPTLVRPARKRLFYLKAKNGLGRFAPSALPHYNFVWSVSSPGEKKASFLLCRISHLVDV